MLTAAEGPWGLPEHPRGSASRGARNRVPRPLGQRQTGPLPRRGVPGEPGDAQGFRRTCMDAVGLGGPAPATIADYQVVRVLGEVNHGRFYLARPPARLGLLDEF